MEAEGLPPAPGLQASPALTPGHSAQGVKGEGDGDGVVVAGDTPAANGKPAEVKDVRKDAIAFPDVPGTTLPLRLLDGG